MRTKVQLLVSTLLLLQTSFTAYGQINYSAYCIDTMMTKIVEVKNGGTHIISGLGMLTDSTGAKWCVLTDFYVIKTAIGNKAKNLIVFISKDNGRQYYYEADLPIELPIMIIDNELIFKIRNQVLPFKMNAIRDVMCFPIGCIERMETS